ncbi:MAG TPA: hypothetical protein VF532_17920 [Candidatus Angelobacter sp.]
MKSPTDTAMSAKTLNVIFAGPMIFLMENPQVRVLVPAIEGHQYTIDHAAAASGAFSLRGASGAGNAAQIHYELPRGADAFRLSASQLHLTLDTQKQAFQTFLLPAPNRVVALSAREADIIDGFGNRRTAVMPTSYAFVYDVSGTENLALAPNPGWSARNRMIQGRFTNLVITGELPGQGLDPTGQHARAAFREMTSFFPGLQMQFFDSGEETQSGTVEGLPEEFLHPHAPMTRNASEARLVPAVLDNRISRARFVPVTSVMECKLGGVIVTKP